MNDLKIYMSTGLLSFLMVVFMPGNSSACDSGTSYTQQIGSSFCTGSESLRYTCNEENTCQNSGEHSDCGEHCKDQCCRCGTSSVGAFLLFLPVDSGLKIDIDSEDKLHFGYLRGDLSLGFSSIWQPPKIS